MAALEDLEARVCALEASQADYRAVLSAVNALGANQREMAINQREMAGTLREVAETQREQGARIGSLEENVSEMKELLIRALERP